MTSPWASGKMGGFDLSKSFCLSQKAAQMWAPSFWAERGLHEAAALSATFKATSPTNE